MNSEKLSNIFYRNFGSTGLENLASEKRKGDVAFLVKLIGKKDKVLDLGCGYGRVSLALAAKGHDITGVDLSPGLIKEGRRRAKQLHLSVPLHIGSMLRTGLKNEHFDKVLCLWSTFNYLLTLKEQQKALNEMYRVLKQNGLAFIEVVDSEAKNIAKKLMDEGIGTHKRVWAYDRGVVNKEFNYMHTRLSLAKLCRSSRFRKFKVQFKNFDGKRRIVVYLFKQV